MGPHPAADGARHDTAQGGGRASTRGGGEGRVPRDGADITNAS
jgi:hypothetical protein